MTTAAAGQRNLSVDAQNETAWGNCNQSFSHAPAIKRLLSKK
jgi:hypothetical protein